MGKGESCDVMLLQQDTVTGAFNACSRCTMVGHSSGSVLAVLAEAAAVKKKLGVKPTQHTLLCVEVGSRPTSDEVK